MIKSQKTPLYLFRWLMLPLLLVIATSGFGAAHADQADSTPELIADYRAEQIRFHLNPDHPTTFASVSFNLRGPADQVSVGLGDPVGAVAWTACSPGTDAEYICDLRALALPVDQVVRIHISASY